MGLFFYKPCPVCRFLAKGLHWLWDTIKGYPSHISKPIKELSPGFGMKKKNFVYRILIQMNSKFHSIRTSVYEATDLREI